MASLAKAPPCAAGLVRQFGVDGDDFDIRFMQPKVECGAPLFAEPRLDDDGGLEKCRGRH